MILGWPLSKIVSGDPDFQPRWRQAKNKKGVMKLKKNILL
jgi:hypothetical protein